ncbi:MAG: ROK family protein [Candidatus Aminicenantes bacterium]|nr:ROK family protein [Candidatus Aminicenantes bacterium]
MNVPIYCGAIDVGGTKIASALFTREGEIAARQKIAVDKAGGDAAAAQVAGRIEALEAAAATMGGQLATVGICVPGIAYSGSGKVWAPNIPGWDRYPLLEKIKEQDRGHVPLVRVPIVLDSDRSAYVAGESWRGAAAGAKDVVFLAVGTGIGAGIIAGGRIVHGHEDIAGAVGWFGLDPAFKPEYASMGCFEAEASGGSVARKARTRLAEGRPSSMLALAGGDLEAVTAEIVAAAARSHDPLALEIVAGAVTYLAMGIANIVSIMNPEAVVLGGGLFRAADLFLEPVRREFRRWAQPLAARTVRIELSLLGEDAGLYGCGKLAWDVVQERGHVPEVHVPAPPAVRKARRKR